MKFLIPVLLLLTGCQITVDPVMSDYYGLHATFTVSPNVMADPPHDLPNTTNDENDDAATE